MKKSNLNKITLKIKGHPIPKPRTTRRDKWNPRPIVINYYKYADKVRDAYYDVCEKQKKLINFNCVAVSFTFYYAGSLNKGDADNIAKGILDALKHANVFPDDTLQYVRQYDKVEVIPLCEVCEKKCKGIKKCELPFTIMEIREMSTTELEELLEKARKVHEKYNK